MRLSILTLLAFFVLSCNKNDDNTKTTTDCLKLLSPASNTTIAYDTAVFQWQSCDTALARFIISAYTSLPFFDTILKGTSLRLVHKLPPDSSYFVTIIAGGDTVNSYFKTTTILNDVAGSYYGLYKIKMPNGTISYSASGTLNVVRGGGFIYFKTEANDPNMAMLADSMTYYSPFDRFAFFSGQNGPINLYYFYYTDSIQITKGMEQTASFEGVKQ